MKLSRLFLKTTPYIFILPALFLLCFALIYPVVYGLGLSLFDFRLSDIRKGPTFIGFQNYVELFKSPFFFTSVRVTLVYSISCVLFQMIFGLFLALLLEKKISGLRIFRTVFILPIMIAPVVVGVVWRYLYDPSFGFINFFMKLMGLQPQAWLSDKSLALVAIVVTQIWQWTPFVFLLLLAGLQGIDRELLEAAEIDGATYWQNLVFIRLPLIKSIIAVAAAMRLIDAFRGLVVVYNMTFGGPGVATQTLALYLYKTAFVSQRLGLASAVAFVLLVIIFLLTLFLLFLMRSEEK